MRLNIATLALAMTTGLLVPVSAHAQASAWNFAVGAGTDNRSKDVSKSDGQAFVWGQAEWQNDSGLFYAGPSFETIKSGGSDLELSLAAGVRPQWAGFDFDLNASHKWRIDADPGADADAWEFTADAKRSIGPANARLRLQHSPDGTGSTKDWTWVAARAGWDFTDRLGVSAEIGHRSQTNAISYTGYNIGAAYALTNALELDVRWFGTDVKAGSKDNAYKDRLVAGVTYAF